MLFWVQTEGPITRILIQQALPYNCLPRCLNLKLSLHLNSISPCPSRWHLLLSVTITTRTSTNKNLRFSSRLCVVRERCTTIEDFTEGVSKLLLHLAYFLLIPCLLFFDGSMALPVRSATILNFATTTEIVTVRNTPVFDRCKKTVEAVL